MTRYRPEVTNRLLSPIGQKGDAGQNAPDVRCRVQNLLSLWSSLSIARRIMTVGSAVLMFAAVLGLSRMAATPGMALLYSGDRKSVV